MADNRDFMKKVRDAFVPVRELMQDMNEIWSPTGEGIQFVRGMQMIAQEAAKTATEATEQVLIYTGWREFVEGRDLSEPANFSMNTQTMEEVFLELCGRANTVTTMAPRRQEILAAAFDVMRRYGSADEMIVLLGEFDGTIEMLEEDNK